MVSFLTFSGLQQKQHLYLHWILLISLGAITVWPVISCLFPSHHNDVKTQQHSHLLAISKKFFTEKTTKLILKMLHIWPDAPHSAWISDCERVNKKTVTRTLTPSLPVNSFSFKGQTRNFHYWDLKFSWLYISINIMPCYRAAHCLHLHGTIYISSHKTVFSIHTVIRTLNLTFVPLFSNI